jgi:hypothetical protein
MVELADQASHAWFIGFDVLIENGVYGGTAAAPAAVKLGAIRQ